MPSNADIRLPGNHAEHAASRLLSFEFVGPGNGEALLGTEHLSGPITECWSVGGNVEYFDAGAFSGARNEQYQFLHCQVDLTDSNVRQTTRELYQQLVEQASNCRYSQPVRFWNYVPSINQLSEPADADSEVYRQFCWGRAEALEAFDFPLPAATAVGCTDDKLYIALLSATHEISVSHFENPRQLSAYRYPRQYGPRSPSFARASVVQAGDDSLLLLSGTASIVQHETRHPGELRAQMRETSANIDCLLEGVTRGLGGNIERFEPISSRCYLRRATDLAEASLAFSESLAAWPEPAFLENDICRSELVMEIEAVFRAT